jgi:hypothetical protein
MEVIKFIIVIIFLILGQVLIGDLIDTKQFFGFCSLIAAGCISFKTDW